MRDVAGLVDFDQLAVRKILERVAAEHRPVAEGLDRRGRGIATEEHAAVALADDEKHRHLQQAILVSRPKMEFSSAHIASLREVKARTLGGCFQDRGSRPFVQ